jgi:tryptophanyl-tRNA synthetase
MHAITLPHDPAALRETTRQAAAIYLAAGIDPQKSAIFVQSHVSAHAELAWILTTQTPLGWLYRMTQFKDKSAKINEQDSIPTGLLTYPVLMAADILLYHAAAVPVGEDQRQHIEITRDLAQRFNHLYGETFTVPDAMIPKAGARIMGLDNPLAKMSKSNDAELHAVFILDGPDTIKRKIMRATTDSGRDIRFSSEPERAGVNNLLTIYQAYNGKSREAIEAEFEGKGYGDLKKAVVAEVIDRMAPLQERYHRYMNESGYLDGILSEGASRARAVADVTLREAKDKIGYLLP